MKELGSCLQIIQTLQMKASLYPTKVSVHRRLIPCIGFVILFLQKKITDEEAIEIAKILLDFGANVDGDKIKENKDTPLLAAASLHAEQLGIFYIENGADIHYAGRHDGATALHWAAFCGRDKLVEKLIREKVTIDQRDTSYNSTPLVWAIQPLMTEDKSNTCHQVSCIKLLLKAGADITTLNSETIQYLQFLAKDDIELNKLLN